MQVAIWRHAKIFLNSMYERVITSCAREDVLDFKHRGVKMFLLYILYKFS